MSSRVDTQVVKDLASYGGDTATECFNCGNCTAVCGLTDNDASFPRKFIRYIQLGLKDKMKSSIDPWMCYYCGECSDTCPRDAEPGKLMMAARRWLTAAYDWTGISRLMYQKEWTEFLFLGIVAAVVVALFTIPANFGFNLLAQHPEARETVMLHSFAPKEIVHVGDLILAGLLSFFLLTNAARMVSWTMKGSGAGLGSYVAEFKEMVIHGLTQKRWSKCETSSGKHWIRHIFLVTGYGTMFLLVVALLPIFQIEDASFHWTSLLGYYGTLVLLAVSTWLLIDRAQGKDQIHKDSHLSDWLFPILLLLTALSGIMLHLFRIFDQPMPAYVMYVVHLAIAVPMLAVEVPFGKWAHLLYRPTAAYLSAVRKRAEATATQPALQPEAA